MISARAELCLGAGALISSLLLGGGTRSGFLSDAILQTIALVVLLLLLWRRGADERFIHHRWSRAGLMAFAACVMLAGLPLLQVVPLPVSLWTLLPGRSLVIDTFDALARPLPWLPLSLTTGPTWAAALAFLPPVAVFVAVLSASTRERRHLSLILLVVGMVSAIVGLLQVAQGPFSPLRFFEFTNPFDAVGFFANRNHFSALLYCLLLVAVAWVVDSVKALRDASGRLQVEAWALVPLVASLLAVVVLIGAQTIARSRAGLGLTMLALIAAFALSLPDRHRGGRLPPVRLLLGAVTIALVFALQFSLYRIMERLEADPLADARIPFARNTLAAAKAFMPFGSGLGSFVPVYASVEPPTDALAETFANHAHNDFLELWLELGGAGVAIPVVVLLWLLQRAFVVWRPAPDGGREIDYALQRAATIVIALLLLHSLVDYPLRTSALMSTFAFAAALLIPPPPGYAEEDDHVGHRSRRHSRSRSTGGKGHHSEDGSPDSRAPLSVRPAVGPQTVAGPLERRPWGEGMEWPESWRKSPQRSINSGGDDKGLKGK